MADGEHLAVLVTTFGRPELLASRALASVATQERQPDIVVLVDNSPSEPDRRRNESVLTETLGPEQRKVYLRNSRGPGAAGTWNTGLHWLHDELGGSSWVAIIDDDDEWTPDHLQSCWDHRNGVDAVLGGIRTLLDGEAIEDRLPDSPSVADFFASNPGWQGSNTFVRLDSILSVSGFDEGLLSTHDRDLAVRCLSHPGFTIRGTGKVSVLYHLERERDSLTMTTGRGKHTGLLQYFAKHGPQMTAEDTLRFKQRAETLFGLAPEFFDIVDTSSDRPGFPRAPRDGGSRLRRACRRAGYSLRRRWSRVRTTPLATRVLGTEFTRSTTQIEIDITYACNLRCHDCNRSCRQAPENSELSLEDVKRFVDDSLERGHEWHRIRVLGGEPTLHSEFEQILYELGRYKLAWPRTRLELVTNGHGRRVNRMLLHVPPFFHIENTAKESDVQPHFYSFNLAPSDRKSLLRTDYRNGCSNIEDCGIGLGPGGYYPCAIAIGIDRVAGWGIGRSELPDRDDRMEDILERSCGLCGRFPSRSFVPYDIVAPNTPGQMSASWEQLYEEWRARRETRG